MILQSTFSASTSNSLPSILVSSLSFPSESCSFIPLTKFKTLTHSAKCSPISQAYNSYGAVNNQTSVGPKWTRIFKRVSLMEDPELGVASVLDNIEKEGNQLTKWILCRVVKELRKFKRFKLALEVYEWMNNRTERFKLSKVDTAIQLDLTARVHGLSSAEDYFVRIPDTEKDNTLYGALLAVYVRAKEREKAESLMDQMRNKGYANCAVRFNLMMSLYMKLNEYDKIDQLVSEMKEKNIRLDTYSYSSWLSAQRSKGFAEGMEHVLEQLKLDSTISPDWMMFSTMASCYMKLGQIEKAEECLRNLETGIRGRDNMPYRCLMSLYSTLGKKEEVYRVWSLCKSKFPRASYGAYHVVISAHIRWGDIQGAEKFYQEWLQSTSTYEPRMGNLLMACYVREEHFEKAKLVFDQMIEAGGRPNSSSWEILGWGHTKEGRIHDALSCFREAVSFAKGKTAWKPQPYNVSAFLELCEKEGDMASKDEFVRLLGELSCFQDRTFKSILGDHNSIEVGDHDDHVLFGSKADTDDETEETQTEVSEMLVSVME